VTRIISLAVGNLATPKARAKHKPLFNKPASEAGLLNRRLVLSSRLGVAKFIIITDMILVTLCFAT
jgi:hypothetical protein